VGREGAEGEGGRRLKGWGGGAEAAGREGTEGEVKGGARGLGRGGG